MLLGNYKKHKQLSKVLREMQYSYLYEKNTSNHSKYFSI